jgi:anti-anti-sigma factor
LRIEGKQAAIMSTGEPPINLHTLNLHMLAGEGATTVRCTGRLTIDTSPKLKTEVKALLVNKRRVILDLTDLAHMDSSGLGALVALYISAKSSGCELQMVNLSPRIRELMSMTNIISLFESCGRYGGRMP